MSLERAEKLSDKAMPGGRAVSAALLAAITLAGTVRADGDAPTGFEPLSEKRLGPGDIELRIHYLGSQFRVSRWWVFTRSGASTEALALGEAPPEPGAATKKPFSRGVSSKLWSSLEKAGFFDLPGNTDEALCRDPIPAESDILLVEVLRGERYREFSYYEPTLSACGRADEFRNGLDVFKKLLGDAYAIP